MSVKLGIWTGVKTPLQELKDEGTINHFDIWNNQINNETVEIPFDFPAVFMGFTSMPWDSTQLKLNNQGLLNTQLSYQWTLTFYIFFESYEEEISTFENNDAILDLILAKFHMLDISEYISKFIRIDERQNQDNSNIIGWEVDFVTQVQETFADDSTDVNVPVGGVYPIEVVINSDLDIDADNIRTGDGE